MSQGNLPQILCVKDAQGTSVEGPSDMFNGFWTIAKRSFIFVAM